MDGQQADGAVGPAKEPTAAEIDKLQQFLGSYTGPNTRGSYTGAGERPDNVRPLVARPTNEID
jgi:hypothetical protein